MPPLDHHCVLVLGITAAASNKCVHYRTMPQSKQFCDVCEPNSPTVNSVETNTEEVSSVLHLLCFCGPPHARLCRVQLAMGAHKGAIGRALAGLLVKGMATEEVDGAAAEAAACCRVLVADPLHDPTGIGY